MADPPGFLERWSRLKQADRAEERHRAMLDSAVPAPAPDSVPPSESDDPLKDLPPIDSLTKDSDFRAFMRPGVPEELRNQALRKLWSSDPVYANLDGLLEYGEDFAEPFRMAGVVATVYRVLEGMPDPQQPAAEPEAAAVAPAPPEGETPLSLVQQPRSPRTSAGASFETPASRAPQDEDFS
jgi:hypothetical protein